MNYANATTGCGTSYLTELKTGMLTEKRWLKSKYPFPSLSRTNIWSGELQVVIRSVPVAREGVSLNIQSALNIFPEAGEICVYNAVREGRREREQG